jgi:predicted nucleic acid-binding protein
VSISHIVVLTGTLLALLALPYVLVRTVSAKQADPGSRLDSPPRVGGMQARGADGFEMPAWPRDRVERQVRRAWFRRNHADRRAWRRLDRTINQPPAIDRLRVERRLPPVEQIAAELRRLNQQRHHGLSRESEKWSAAVATAYDAWLLAACRRLNITEHLTTLAGMDRDLERLRVEGQLETAGLVLRPASSDGR